MKYSLFSAAALLVTGSIAAFAGPINPRGIPADAAAVLHVDLDAGKRSAIYKVAEGLLDSATEKERADIETFKKETGLDITKDITDVTLGVFGDISKLTGGDKSAADVVAFIRGNFNPTTIFVAARKHGYKLTTIQRYVFIEIPEKGDAADAKFYVSPFGTKTLVVLSKLSQAPAVIAAHRGETKSLELPASIVSFVQQIGGAPVVVAYSGTKGKTKKPAAAANDDAAGFGINFPDPVETNLAVGDDGRNLKIRVSALYAAESETQEAQMAAQGILGMVGMFLGGSTAGPDGKPDPKKAADAAKLKKFLLALKISSDGKAFNVSFDYPTAEIVALLREEAAKIEKKQAKPAKSAK
jgi:hypothetical protein